MKRFFCCFSIILLQAVPKVLSYHIVIFIHSQNEIGTPYIFFFFEGGLVSVLVKSKVGEWESNIVVYGNSAPPRVGTSPPLYLWLWFVSSSCSCPCMWMWHCPQYQYWNHLLQLLCGKKEIEFLATKMLLSNFLTCICLSFR